MKEKILSLSGVLKPTKRKVAVFIAVLIAGGLMAGFMGPGGAGGGRSVQQGEAVRTVTLTRGDLESTVSTTGTVYSTKATEIYSNLNYAVKTVSVSVGDKVNEGDVLAELDMAGLESDISQKQASLWASQQSAQQNLATAQQDLAAYQKNLENNHDTNLLNAQSSVTTAELELQSAELDVQSAGNEVHTARRNLRDARNGEGAYEETGEASDSELDALRDALYAKETSLKKAQTNLEKAQANLNKAKDSLAAAQEGASDTLATYQSKVQSAQISNNFNDQYISIQKLQGDLEKCVITTPVSGTVTAVNAVEGGSGSGLLFVIQDTENLKVVTNIKEYDIDAVNIGDRVVIKADATGDREFSGTLSKIAPTSTLTASGAASTSTDAEFESEVTVSTLDKGLRIGMNTRLSIITGERKSIFSVPYEAVGTGSDGSAYIYVMTAGEDGGAAYEKVSVTTGMETNLYVEISGENLREGMQVVRSASSVSDRQGAQTQESGNAPDAQSGQEESASGIRSGSEAMEPRAVPEGEGQA